MAIGLKAAFPPVPDKSWTMAKDQSRVQSQPQKAPLLTPSMMIDTMAKDQSHVQSQPQKAPLLTPTMIDAIKRDISDLVTSPSAPHQSSSSPHHQDLLQRVALYPELLLDTSSAVPLLLLLTSSSLQKDGPISAIASYIHTAGSSCFLAKALKFLRSLVASVSDDAVLYTIHTYACLQTCVSTVAASFSKCIDETLSWMPVSLFVHILEQDCLDMNRSTQISIYMIVCRYYEFKGVSSSQSDEILARKAPPGACQGEDEHHRVSQPRRQLKRVATGLKVSPEESDPAHNDHEEDELMRARVISEPLHRFCRRHVSASCNCPCPNSILSPHTPKRRRASLIPMSPPAFIEKTPFLAEPPPAPFTRGGLRTTTLAIIPRQSYSIMCLSGDGSTTTTTINEDTSSYNRLANNCRTMSPLLSLVSHDDGMANDYLSESSLTANILARGGSANNRLNASPVPSLSTASSSDDLSCSLSLRRTSSSSSHLKEESDFHLLDRRHHHREGSANKQPAVGFGAQSDSFNDGYYCEGLSVMTNSDMTMSAALVLSQLTIGATGSDHLECSLSHHLRTISSQS